MYFSFPKNKKNKNKPKKLKNHSKIVVFILRFREIRRESEYSLPQYLVIIMSTRRHVLAIIDDLPDLF